MIQTFLTSITLFSFPVNVTLLVLFFFKENPEIKQTHLDMDKPDNLIDSEFMENLSPEKMMKGSRYSMFVFI